MFKKLSMIGAAITMGAATLIPATPAMARDGYYQSGRDGYYRGDRYRGDRSYRGDRNRSYRGNSYYRGDSYYRGNDHRRYRGERCDSGTGGTIIGAIAGGLLGNEVAGRGDRTEGTIIGGAVGALAGRAIDRSDGRRC